MRHRYLTATRLLPAAIVCASAILIGGCSAPDAGTGTPGVGEFTETVGSEAEPAGADPRPVLVAFGDSLTAGRRGPRDSSYPGFLQAEFDRRGRPLRVVNEGVSGDTTAVALARIDVALAHDPKWAIVALGANDGMRGLPIGAMERNLREIVSRFQAHGANVVLAGMKLPRNYGPEFVQAFDGVFPRLAADMELHFIPFLLENVAMVRELNHSDGIHPNAEGNALIAKQVADAFDAFAPL
ncbi:MAG: arylesterase [Bryobacterales bacterium]|nr:arylesterase [Bryobacterales bacterium]